VNDERDFTSSAAVEMWDAARLVITRAGNFIDACNDLREAATNPEVKSMYSIAITEAQTAQMWAVKAATWR